VRFEQGRHTLLRNKTFAAVKAGHNSILRRKPRRQGSHITPVPINEIGQQMNLLFKDEPLYEKELMKNPNFKLQSLRDLSGIEIMDHMHTLPDDQ